MSNPEQHAVTTTPQSVPVVETPARTAPTKGARIQSVAITKFHAGPLPAVEDFQGYENVLPGAADRILGLAEKQSDHRRVIEKVVVFGNVLLSAGGIVAAYQVTSLVATLAASLVTAGHPIWGFSALIGNLGALVSVFIYARRTQVRSQAEKLAAEREAQREADRASRKQGR